VEIDSAAGDRRRALAADQAAGAERLTHAGEFLIGGVCPHRGAPARLQPSLGQRRINQQPQHHQGGRGSGPCTTGSSAGRSRAGGPCRDLLIALKAGATVAQSEHGQADCPVSGCDHHPGRVEARRFVRVGMIASGSSEPGDQEAVEPPSPTSTISAAPGRPRLTMLTWRTSGLMLPPGKPAPREGGSRRSKRGRRPQRSACTAAPVGHRLQTCSPTKALSWKGIRSRRSSSWAVAFTASKKIKRHGLHQLQAAPEQQVDGQGPAVERPFAPIASQTGVQFGSGSPVAPLGNGP